MTCISMKYAHFIQIRLFCQIKLQHAVSSSEMRTNRTWDTTIFELEKFQELLCKHPSISKSSFSLMRSKNEQQSNTEFENWFQSSRLCSFQSCSTIHLLSFLFSSFKSRQSIRSLMSKKAVTEVDKWLEKFRRTSTKILSWWT